jgi:GMP synthase (glutamine-hydrolysing)
MLYTLKKADAKALALIKEEKQVRQTNEVFLLFSLGSQFDHLIKQCLEKLGVFCLVADPSLVTAEDVSAVNPKGMILSGGPASVHVNPPTFDSGIFDLGVPVLGICLGFQLWSKYVGCEIESADKREFAVHTLSIEVVGTELFVDCEQVMPVLQSHGDRVIANDIQVLANTENSPVAAAHRNHLWGVQFHPEVTETTFGMQMFENFCFKICRAKDRYPAQDIAAQKVQALREQIGDKKVLLALSGGTDSSVTAYLIRKALNGNKEQFFAVYIEATDRPDDKAHVIEYFGNQDWLQLKFIDATQQFLAALKGKVSMPEKRRALHGIYGTTLDREIEVVGAGYVAQGTLYTDLAETGTGYSTGAKKARIKLHHNVGHEFSVQEIIPLADCVKDSARNIGRIIGVPEVLLTRHPFPGPGHVVRIEGEIDATKLGIVDLADGIYISELRNWDLYDKVWQAGAVLTNSVTTCTKGDDATSGYVVALWAVWSVNGFTAQPANLPWDFLIHVATRMTNEIKEVGRVVYNISGKPPATIEWG